ALGIEKRPFTVKSRGSPPVCPFGCSASHSTGLPTRCAVNVFSTGTKKIYKIHPNTYSFERLEINLAFPNYKDIQKDDSRRFAYKLRNLFGIGFKIPLPSNYPIPPSEYP
ncbi:hypothetical protein ALC56_00826, partial [Trachymyrmex septentrionalis]